MNKRDACQFFWSLYGNLPDRRQETMRALIQREAFYGLKASLMNSASAVLNLVGEVDISQYEELEARIQAVNELIEKLQPVPEEDDEIPF